MGVIIEKEASVIVSAKDLSSNAGLMMWLVLRTHWQKS